ncbi:hypothetical protein DWZ89_02890 [Faecalibacterium prausnitzii]|uniref:Uncharacterized protein n=1 Tax=Faecalibacterium prausnitzii TaxID=853 RepID=A0A3E2TC71_9FIRM|nr:hypothetical protein DWZ89_02890 [Faecalibacterium prausnitzii]
MVHIKNETNSHQGRHNFPNFALSVSNRKALGKRGDAHASETGHSIARPIACGNRVPPQRTLA